MGRGLFLRGEEAGAFERDVDAEIPVRQLRRVLDRRDLDALAVDDDEIAVDLHLCGELAVHGIVAEQVGVGLDGTQIVDRHDLDVRTTAFHDSAQDVAPDTPEAVDRDLHRHCSSSFLRRGSSLIKDCDSCRIFSTTASAVMPKCR